MTASGSLAWSKVDTPVDFYSDVAVLSDVNRTLFFLSSSIFDLPTKQNKEILFC